MAAELLELARAGKLAGLGSGNNAPQSIGALNSISDLRAAAGAVASTPVPVVRRNADGTITIGSVKYRAQTADKSGYLALQNTIDGTLSDFAVVGGQLQLQQIRAVSGGVEVVRRKGEPVRIKIGNNPLYLDFTNAGDVLGSTLGRYIAGSNQAVGVVSSALLQTVGANLGDVLNQSIDFDN